MLRGMMQEYDPARRRLAEVLVARGGEEEWEEAQKLLEQSAGDPASVVDRFRAGPAADPPRGRREPGQGGRDLPGLFAEPETRYVAAGAGRAPAAGPDPRVAESPDDARKQYRALVDGRPTATLALGLYGIPAFGTGRRTRRNERLKQLEKRRPRTWARCELRARWLRDQKRAAEIEPLVEGSRPKTPGSGGPR